METTLTVESQLPKGVNDPKERLLLVLADGWESETTHPGQRAGQADAGCVG